jgi:hypothetical protein
LYLYLSAVRALGVGEGRPVSSVEPDRVHARLKYFTVATAALGLGVVLLALLGVPSGV